MRRSVDNPRPRGVDGFDRARRVRVTGGVLSRNQTPGSEVAKGMAGGVLEPDDVWHSRQTA